MTDPPKSVSDTTRRDAGLSGDDLWLRYFELGGMGTRAEVGAYLDGATTATDHDHDVLAHALNERYAELGADGRVGYSEHEPSRERSARTGVAGSSVMLGLLGSFTVQVHSEPVALAMNAQRLVAFLALHDGSLLRQHVAGSLWGETTDERAAGSLRSALWRLGRLPHPLVEAVDSHLRLSPHVVVDLDASEALAHRILDNSHEIVDADVDDMLLSHDLLPDWTEDWVLVRRDHHTQLRLRALETLCSRLVELGRFGAAVQAGLRSVSGEPLRESGQRALIAAHLADGNVAAAAAQYELFCQVLHSELGLEPSSALREMAATFGR